MAKKYAIGVDLGGTNLRAALVSEEGEIIRKIRITTTEQVLDTLRSSIGELNHEAVCGIGLGIAGLIDRGRGRVFVSPNLHALDGKDLQGALQDDYGIPVYIENDANAAAIGEKLSGAGKGFENFVLLTLGTSIGGGIIYGGKLLNVSAELGHISINYDGDKCPCGNIGCLENYASARAMIAKAVVMLERGTESLLKECCRGSFYKLTPEDIYRIALDGDAFAREVLKEAGKYLGVGLASIINMLSPEAIILTGGLLGAWNIYVREAIKEASRRSYRDLFDAVKILPSSLGDEAGVIGAAQLVFMGR